jgi:hypothetical protein
LRRSPGLAARAIFVGAGVGLHAKRPSHAIARVALKLVLSIGQEP